MSTKATTTSKRQKVTQIKNAAPEKPEPPAPGPRKGIRLTGIQERIADAVADMLIHGSTRLNLTRLIHATISHDYRIDLAALDPEKLNQSIAEMQARDTDDLLDELAHERTVRPKLREDQRPEPKDILERVRQVARNSCARSLQEFVDNGGPEDIRLMESIMMDYHNAHNAWINDQSFGDAGLASAFMDTIQDRNDYVRVPHSMVDDVTKYIEALWKLVPADKKEAA